ncbi:M20 family metallopeptidase [Cellulomonas sp. 73-92]|uniref:M20 metallopeptidase family protein n=1 Tax=Cellulomonas sp. 73-92 TaxID=1895740 RepID=UPI000A590C70|nr:M20 family metallopeptidase [Cellulomonas sp. 73-92]
MTLDLATLAALRADAVDQLPQVAGLRHALHRAPEIGLRLPATQALILEALAPVGLEVRTGAALDSVVAVLHGGRPGPAVLLRGDMDALPVTEATGEPFTSENAGVMHACGHDMHVAGLVGAARLLAARRDELPGSVVFMFQPGEEGDGGAELMIAEGVLEAAGERVVAGYGLHVRASLLAAGRVASRPGPLLAAADRFRVTVHGRGGHGSTPWYAADPVPVAAEMLLAMQSMVTRTFDVFDPVVVTAGLVQAGTANNIIPDDALLDATVRTLSAAHRAAAEERIRRLVDGIAAAHGMTAALEWIPGYPVTVNHAPEVARLATLTTAMYDEATYVQEAQPVLGAEDFSYVLEQVPGAFFWLGATPPGLDPGTAPYNHSAGARFADEALAVGPAVLAALALDRLAQG